MTYFEYDPTSLNRPDRLVQGVILDGDVAYRDRLAIAARSTGLP